MEPYALEIIAPADLSLFYKIREVVTKMPEVDLGTRSDRKVRGIGNGKVYVSCHMLTRALAVCFPVKVKDGHFHGLWEHSWLVTENERTIIDPYPVAVVGGPILLDISCLSPWMKEGVYEEGVLSSLNKDPNFPSYVVKVTEVVCKTAKRLGY